MVKHNFSLLELRNMYIDEFMLYYLELVYVLEEGGELKEGTYEQIRLGIEEDDSVDKLFSFFKKNKPKQ